MNKGEEFEELNVTEVTHGEENKMGLNTVKGGLD